jgi:hypothetical protein
MPKAKLPNGVHVRVQGKVGWMQLWCVIVSAKFGVNDLAHCFGDHFCLCGIVFKGI